MIAPDEPDPPLPPPGPSPRRRRAARTLALLATGAVLAALLPARSAGVTGAVHDAAADGTRRAVQAVAGLARGPALREHLRAGFRECGYDWRLTCRPSAARLARTRPAPPADPASPAARAAHQQAREAWEAERRAAAAYEGSPWKRWQPVLRWPGAAAHAARQATGATPAGWAALGLVLLLGAGGATLLPLGGWAWLLLPATALAGAWLLDRLLVLAGAMLEWPGQLLLLLEVARTAWRLATTARERTPGAEGLGRRLRRRLRRLRGEPPAAAPTWT
jgi:hypothetical protein